MFFSDDSEGYSNEYKLYMGDESQLYIGEGIMSYNAVKMQSSGYCFESYVTPEVFAVIWINQLGLSPPP